MDEGRNDMYSNMRVIDDNGKKLAIVEFAMTPELCDSMKEFFNCDIEMLQGEFKDLGDGRHQYKFQIHDEEKIELVRMWILEDDYNERRN